MVQLNVWQWDPSILVGIGILVVAYWAITGPLHSRIKGSSHVPFSQGVYFLAGLALIFLSLVTPLDYLAENYLFSAHMLQHMCLAFVAPLLLLAGTPGWALSPLLVSKPLRQVAHILTSPLVAFTLFNGVFMLWHVPAAYEAALHDERIHIVQHLSFMATGVINWWPVLSPVPELPRISPPAQMLYLFLDSIPNTVLTALLVFSPDVIYTTYAAAPRIWGLDPLTDQQIGGLLMMPGGMIYLVALGVVFYQWMEKKETAG